MNTQWLRIGALGSFIAAGLLAVQFALAAGLGSDLVLLETSFDAARVNVFLQTHAANVTGLMVADNLFVVAYTTAFLGLAVYAVTRKRLFALAALGFALLTSVSDITENALTIAMARAVTDGITVEAQWLLLLQMLAQVKWMWIYVGVTLFAATLWGDVRRAQIVAVLFLIFPLLGVMAPVSVMLALARILWMFVLLIAGGIFLWGVSKK